MRLLSARKAAVAIATVVAMFAVFASPASAAGPFPIDVTGGTLVAAGNTFDLTPGSGEIPPCPDKDSTLVLNTDTPAVGSWTVTGGFTSFFQLGTPPSGPWYQADFIVNGRGTYSGSAPSYTLTTSATPHLTFQVRIYEVDGPVGNCTKNLLRCVIAGRAVGTGTYNGTLPSSATGDTAVFNAATNNPGGLNMVTSSCAAPFVSWNGQSAVLTGLTMQVQ